MADCTITEVFGDVRALFGEDVSEGEVYTDSMLTPFFGTAYRELFRAFQSNSLPIADRERTFTLPASTTSYTPAQAGITDFGEPLSVFESSAEGQSEMEVHETDRLPSTEAGTELRWWLWRGDTFYFVGSTESRFLRVTYTASGNPPQAGSVGIDDARDFLAYRTASLAGRTRDEERSEQFRLDALGPRLQADGSGGLLFQLLNPMILKMQSLPRRRQPFRPRRHSLLQQPYI